MVPILSNLFPHLLTLNDSIEQSDRVQKYSSLPSIFLLSEHHMFLRSQRRQLRAAVKSGEAPCPPLKFFVVYMATYPFPNCMFALVCCSSLGTKKRKTLIVLDLVQFSWALCGQNFCQQYTYLISLTFPHVFAWQTNSYWIVLISEKKGCVTKIWALVTGYICQSLLHWDAEMENMGGCYSKADSYQVVCDFPYLYCISQTVQLTWLLL